MMPTAGSHPAGVRVLKHLNHSLAAGRRLSHPAGVRVLKRPNHSLAAGRRQSHPAGVRVLKLQRFDVVYIFALVAPRRGACVETRQWYPYPCREKVAPRRGACVETPP